MNRMVMRQDIYVRLGPGFNLESGITILFRICCGVQKVSVRVGVLMAGLEGV
jgi:hypothetical protein